MHACDCTHRANALGQAPVWLAICSFAKPSPWQACFTARNPCEQSHCIPVAPYINAEDVDLPIACYQQHQHESSESYRSSRDLPQENKLAPTTAAKASVMRPSSNSTLTEYEIYEVCAHCQQRALRLLQRPAANSLSPAAPKRYCLSSVSSKDKPPRQRRTRGNQICKGAC